VPYAPLELTVTAGQPWSFTVPDDVFSQINVGVYGYELGADG
jgi:hypothetical protein